MNRQTVMEIDKDAFFKNIENIKKLSGNKELMYIMKANSYGTYLNKHIDIIKDFKIIGVAIVKEAIELRQIGFKNEIFVFQSPFTKVVPISARSAPSHLKKPAIAFPAFAIFPPEGCVDLSILSIPLKTMSATIVFSA